MKILKALFSVFLVAGVLVICVFAIVKMPKRLCESMVVVAHSRNESAVLTRQDVEAVIANAGIRVIGEKMKDIDLDHIKRLLQQNPYIQKLNFIRFSGRQLRIDYTLKPFIVHVYDIEGHQYFAGRDGELLPYTEKMQDNLIIVNGNIHQNYKKGVKAGKTLMAAVHLANLIDGDDFYRAQFRQIYVNENQQMELVSTVGGQIILFGNDDNAAEKLMCLKEVYRNGLSRKGYDHYAQLDVRYRNRIIAQRK